MVGLLWHKQQSGIFLGSLRLTPWMQDLFFQVLDLYVIYRMIYGLPVVNNHVCGHEWGDSPKIIGESPHEWPQTFLHDFRVLKHR